MQVDLGEVTSTLAPEVNTAGADEVAITAEVETSAQQDPRTECPEVTGEGLGQSLAQPTSSSAPPSQAEAPRVNPPEIIPPPQPAVRGRSGAGWAKEAEEALRGCSLKEEHRALIGATLEGYRSAEAGLHEVFKNLVAGFEVRLLRIRFALSL
jgi:hypothetical protein